MAESVRVSDSKPTKFTSPNFPPGTAFICDGCLCIIAGESEYGDPMVIETDTMTLRTTGWEWGSEHEYEIVEISKIEYS